MPIVAACLEVLDSFLFDTLHTLAPRHTLRDREQMFVIPLGGQVATNEGPRCKEYAETNLFQAGTLDAPRQFVVHRIRCVFIGRKIVPCSSLYYADTSLRLMIGQKPYWNGPAWKCADPVTMVLNPDTLLAMGRHARVDLVRALRHTLNPAPMIRTQEPFHVEVTFGKLWREFRDDAPDRLVVLLEGIEGRAIQ